MLQNNPPCGIIRKKEGIIMPRTYRTFTLDDYDVTKSGEIINKHSGRHVKAQKNGKGYLRVSIGGRLEFVHRLVATLYVPNPENKPQVNHKDGNKLNNCAENLEWVTNQENRNHAVKSGLQLLGERCPWSKLSSEQVDFIRNHTELNSKELAKVFNISASHVRDIRRYKSWTH